MTHFNHILLAFAGAVCLLFEAEQAQAATASNPITVNYQQSLPPLAIDPRTNGFRLRFNGNPAQKFTIERAVALTGPWTAITTRNTPATSTLLQYDDTNHFEVPTFYRITHTNSAPIDGGIPLLLPSKRPDYLLSYGTNSNQKAELRVPPGAGPHPVVIIIHGGCWQSSFPGFEYFGPVADALTAFGFATWNIEYRRLGQAGAGWPGTYLDVGHAVDHLRTIALEHQLDLNHVVVFGHSAGGHLAMWVAARSRLPAGSDIYVENPLPIRGVINLAGTAEMQAVIPFETKACLGAVVEGMLGGSPQKYPERYAQANAIDLLPLGKPQILIWGEQDDVLPLSIGKKYVEAATTAGDPVLLIEFPGLGHFDTVSPLSACWPVVRSAIESLMERN
jgi:acetyl esterase/lipase